MAEARKGRSRGRRTPKADEAEFGNDGKAHNGEPIEDVPGGTAEGGMSAEDDELARRRANKGNGGDALGDKVLDDDEDGQEELFPMGTLEGDPKVTLKNLIKPNHRIEYTASKMSAEVPVTGGLIDPYADGQSVDTYELAKIELVPIRESDAAGVRKIVGWKVRSKLRPVHIAPVESAAPDAATG